MSKPFEWKDHNKRFNDLNTNNFPTFAKSKQLQDSIKFKASSKAQKGVKFDTTVTNNDASTTDAEFSSKINLDELKGLELGFKAKSKPSTEFSAKFTDDLAPFKDSNVTMKLAAANAAEQTFGATLGYSNQLVNFNFGFSYPITRQLFDFVAPGEELEKQPAKIDLDFVAKPLEDKDVYLGGNASISIPIVDEITYTSKLALILDNSTFNGGAFIEHKKDDKKVHQTKYGSWAYTEVNDLSGGAQITYAPAETEPNYKGFSFEAVAGIQRDADSKLSTKVQVLPHTTVSLGYEQKLNKAVKLSFGYSFLLSKVATESKTKSSAFAFGIELSH